MSHAPAAWGLAFLLLGHAGLAHAQDETAREAELFGEPASAASSTPTADRMSDRESSLFGEVASSTAATSEVNETDVPAGVFDDGPSEVELAARLAAKEDFLAIGGFLWQRLEYNVVDADAPETFPLTAPGFGDLYLDARPNDRVRAYIRGRLRYNPTVQADQPNAFGQPTDPVQVQLDQIWMKFDIQRRVFVTVGKERVKWGVGRFWNPTDFLNQQRLDPLSGVVLFDERLGVPMIDFHIPIESLGWNFHAIANIDEAFSPDQIGGAFLAEMLVGPAEVSLVGAFRKDDTQRLGMMVSSGLWLFDIRAELALLHGNKTPFVKGSCAPNAFVDNVNRGVIDPTDRPFDINEYPEYFGELDNRSDDWIPQVVGGAEIGIRYSDQDSIYVGAEYFYNNTGYADSSRYACLIPRGAFDPFYLGRHYAAAYAFLPAPGNWNDTSFVLSSISNLSDLSNVSRIDYTVRVLTFLNVNAFFQVHLGKDGGEFTYTSSLIPLDLSGLPSDVQDTLLANPQVALLASGLTIPRPIFELGMGLKLDY